MKNGNKKKFQVSVILPVWNAEKFLLQAVESALNQEQVGEIILVEDNSPDNALQLCKKLEEEHSIIKLLRHPNGENRGAAASRNLGILKSNFDYIAFLDADDWYLPNRFKRDEEIFFQNPQADVVYSYTRLYENFKTSEDNVFIKRDIRAIIGKDATPIEFYRYITRKRYPPFHINSITIKKKFLLEDKLFDVRVNLHEDSELYRRMLRRGYFLCGEQNRPVALVRRHDDNRITSRTSDTRLNMYACFLDNVGVNNLYEFERRQIIKNILRAQGKDISSNRKRRAYYYSKLLMSAIAKEKFLIKFRREVLDKGPKVTASL